MVSRSNISVVSAVRHPSFTPPTTASASKRTSSKKTSLNSASPEICRRPRIVTPSASIGTTNIVRPLCFGTSGSLRASRSPNDANCAFGRPHLLPAEPPRPVVLPAGAGLDAREVGAGGGLGEELAPHLVAVEHRAEVTRLLRVGAMADDRRPEHADADRV